MHPGISKFYNTLKCLVVWKALKADVTSFVESCHLCHISKHKTKNYGFTTKQINSSLPWRSIGLDIKGPYQINNQNHYCLTIIDHSTRWCELIGITALSAEATVDAFEQNWLCRYPRPSIVITDNGTNFISDDFRILLKGYGIVHAPIPAYHPQANGITERIHQLVGDGLRINPPVDFHASLQQIAWAYRSSYHRILDASPAELVFGCLLLDPV